MPGGRPKTSGKNHNKSPKTYLTARQDQASTSTVLPVTGTSSIINYFKRPVEKSVNVDITEEQLTNVWVEIKDEEDENTNDNIAPIFHINEVTTTTESTKELISKKKPQADVQVLHLSISNGKPNILGFTSTILKTDGSVKLAKSVQTIKTQIGKRSPVNTMNTRVNSSLIMKTPQSI